MTPQSLDLSEVDHAIMRELENAHGEGLLLASDIATVLELAPQSMGSRLSALRKHGLVIDHAVEGYRNVKGWEITHDGVQMGPW